jgi:hypothetical protein
VSGCALTSDTRTRVQRPSSVQLRRGLTHASRSGSRCPSGARRQPKTAHSRQWSQSQAPESVARVLPLPPFLLPPLPKSECTACRLGLSGRSIPISF